MPSGIKLKSEQTILEYRIKMKRHKDCKEWDLTGLWIFGSHKKHVEDYYRNSHMDFTWDNITVSLSLFKCDNVCYVGTPLPLGITCGVSRGQVSRVSANSLVCVQGQGTHLSKGYTSTKRITLSTSQNLGLYLFYIKTWEKCKGLKKKKKHKIW